MDPQDLLNDWLATSALRPASRAEYHREVSSFITWCTLTRSPLTGQPRRPVDPIAAGPADIAQWSYDTYLNELLGKRSFDGPDALGYLAEQHPEAARSHDRRITALTGFFDAAVTRRLITIPPNLKVLRSGVPRPPGAKNRLTPRERAVLLAQTGAWGPTRSKHWQRDQLCVYLLLEGLRPAQIVRLDRRHLYPQPDGSWDVRAPDDEENVGRKFTLDPLTGAALKSYLAVRAEPRDPEEHALILSSRGTGTFSRWPNTLIGQIAATHPLLAEREPPVTADAIAHTGLWDQSEKTDG
jgi:integrase